jgi:hypothetical protein
VDYGDWTARESDPQDSSTSWDTGARAPERRPFNAFSTGDEAAPDPGPARPRYSDRDYPNHGYWDNEQPPERTNPSLLPARTDTWPGAGESTGSWRLDSLPVPVSALPTPAQAITPAGFGFDGDDRDYPAVIWWTLIWYAIPIVLYTLWALVMSASSMRGHALHGLLNDVFPGLFAVAISLGFATWIRRISLSWRAITLGFGATAVGAGVATLLVSTL